MAFIIVVGIGVGLLLLLVKAEIVESAISGEIADLQDKNEIGKKIFATTFKIDAVIFCAAFLYYLVSARPIVGWLMGGVTVFAMAAYEIKNGKPVIKTILSAAALSVFVLALSNM